MSEAQSRMMALRARAKHQIGYKFAVLRRLISEFHSGDDELREIVDSIEPDVEWLA